MHRALNRELFPGKQLGLSVCQHWQVYFDRELGEGYCLFRESSDPKVAWLIAVGRKPQRNRRNSAYRCRGRGSLNRGPQVLTRGAEEKQDL